MLPNYRQTIEKYEKLAITVFEYWLIRSLWFFTRSCLLSLIRSPLPYGAILTIGIIGTTIIMRFFHKFDFGSDKRRIIRKCLKLKSPERKSKTRNLPPKENKIKENFVSVVLPTQWAFVCKRRNFSTRKSTWKKRNFDRGSWHLVKGLESSRRGVGTSYQKEYISNSNGNFALRGTPLRGARSARCRE